MVRKDDEEFLHLGYILQHIIYQEPTIQPVQQHACEELCVFPHGTLCQLQRRGDVLRGGSPLIEWQGRIARSSEGVSFDWVGTRFAVKVKGATVLKARLNCSLPPPHAGKIRAFAFDDLDHNTHSQPQTYEWPASEHFLPPGESTVVLVAGSTMQRTSTVHVYQNNNHIGSIGQRSVTLLSLESDGEFLPVPPAASPSRRITFIGDSITAATNNRRPYGDLTINGIDGPIEFLGGAPACADWTGLQGDYTLTYQAQLCRNITGSNCTTIAVGGKGVYKNCCDSNGPTIPVYDVY